MFGNFGSPIVIRDVISVAELRKSAGGVSDAIPVAELQKSAGGVTVIPSPSGSLNIGDLPLQLHSLMTLFEVQSTQDLPARGARFPHSGPWHPAHLNDSPPSSPHDSTTQSAPCQNVLLFFSCIAAPRWGSPTAGEGGAAMAQSGEKGQVRSIWYQPGSWDVAPATE